MSWADIFAPIRQEPKQKMNWGCSVCSRQFLKLENVRCHVLRNSKCSARQATQVRLNNLDFQRNLVRDPDVDRILVEMNENKLEENIIVQRPAVSQKKRTGVRPFPPALIAKIAKEGKELAKVHGRRMTVRILIGKYPLARLTRSSVDR